MSSHCEDDWDLHRRGFYWEGWSVNHKRVYRLYSEDGLRIRAKLPPVSEPGVAEPGGE